MMLNYVEHNVGPEDNEVPGASVEGSVGRNVGDVVATKDYVVHANGMAVIEEELIVSPVGGTSPHVDDAAVTEKECCLSGGRNLTTCRVLRDLHFNSCG
ncbi:MAG: hypothetical protein ACKPKO_18675, partial [Candidatus Fonsibacter sp.]